MADDLWAGVDRLFGERLLGPDDALEQTLVASLEAGLPGIAVSPVQGKLLNLLARMVGARRILEVGTLGGYSALWLARALPPQGRLVTLELDPHHAEVARANLERAGVADRVEVVVGPAIESLRGLPGDQPFDVVFIDADKPGNPAYFAAALRLTRPGSVLVVDNVVRQGRIVTHPDDPAVVGVLELLDLVAAEPRVDATALQTVGTKGHDGLLVALVTA